MSSPALSLPIGLNAGAATYQPPAGLNTGVPAYQSPPPLPVPDALPLDTNTPESTATDESGNSDTFKALPMDTNTPKSTVDLAATGIKSNIKNTVVPAIGHCFVPQGGSLVTPTTGDRTVWYYVFVTDWIFRGGGAYGRIRTHI